MRYSKILEETIKNIVPASRERMEEKERGKYLIIKPHWLNFLAGKSYKKIKTSNSPDQSLLDV